MSKMHEARLVSLKDQIDMEAEKLNDERKKKKRKRRSKVETKVKRGSSRTSTKKVSKKK